MENNKREEEATNSPLRPSKGVDVPKAQGQKEKTEVKDGDPFQSRPEFGSDAGVNTANREHQLPSLNDGGVPPESDDH